MLELNLEIALTALIAFIAVAIMIPLCRKIARKIGLTDAPDIKSGGRKDHIGHIPLIGGLVIIPIFIIASLIYNQSLTYNWPLHTALIILLAVGAADDKGDLHFWIKFGLQFVAAILIVIPGGAQLHSLGNLFGLGELNLGIIALPFSVIAVVLLINAINLMDGLDGLAGGTSFIILGWLLTAGIMGTNTAFAPSITILMATLLGFLIYNMRNPWRRKASVFLGDAGSMCLGLLIGWYAIHLSSAPSHAIEPMVVAWILAIPIWDECAQFYRRVCEGRHPFSADRGHFHHHFIEVGHTPARAVTIILCVVFLCGDLGVIGHKLGVPLPILTFLWIGGILAHMAISKNTERYKTLIGKFNI